jgi:hypothetical protein
MVDKFVIALASAAAIAFCGAIIGVFGLLPAFATLMVFIAFACVLAVRPQRF